MSHLDPRTNQYEPITNYQLPDLFIDTKKGTKSHIPATNTLARINVLVGQLTNEYKICLKRGRLVGSNDVIIWKRRTQEKLDTLEEVVRMTDQSKIDKSIALKDEQIMQKPSEEAHIEQEAPEEAQVPENYKILVSYVHTGQKYDPNNIAINNIFTLKWPVIS